MDNQDACGQCRREGRPLITKSKYLRHFGDQAGYDAFDEGLPLYVDHHHEENDLLPSTTHLFVLSFVDLQNWQ